MGATVNQLSDGEYPLSRAVNCYEIAKLLVDNGALVTSGYLIPQTSVPNIAVIKLFLGHGASAEYKDNAGRTALSQLSLYCAGDHYAGNYHVKRTVTAAKMLFAGGAGNKNTAGTAIVRIQYVYWYLRLNNLAIFTTPHFYFSDLVSCPQFLGM